MYEALHLQPVDSDQENSHYEMATVGAFSSTSDFGTKRINPTTTIVKRINDNPGKVFITMNIN